MRIAKSKKAVEAYDLVYWSVRIMFVILMLFFVYFLARVYESQAIDTTEIEAGTFIRYMLYNPNALPYIDPNSGRTLFGIIDIEKMNSKQLEEAMSFGEENNMVAAKITATYEIPLPEGVSGPQQQKKIEAYYNEAKYNNWLPLSNPSFLREGTVKKIEQTRYVLVKDKEETYPGSIIFEVLVPKT